MLERLEALESSRQSCCRLFEAFVSVGSGTGFSFEPQFQNLLYGVLMSMKTKNIR